MSQNPYQVFGHGTPRMLGRDSLYRDLCRRLDKPTPDNVSLVGPRNFGKTVILRHLSDDFKNGKTGHATFAGAFYWDLSREPPTNNITFLKRFAGLSKEVLERAGVEEHGYIDLAVSDYDALYESLKYAFDELQKREIWLLGVIDGLERSLTEEGLTRSLWGNLRYLASESSLRLVTGSRHSISDLCMTEGARDSNFHQIFNSQPIEVGRFVEQDWISLFVPLAEKAKEVAESARKELLQWSGGAPLLAAAVLEQTFQNATGASVVGQPDISAIAQGITDSRRDILKVLWDDCSPEMQADLCALQERDVRRDELSADRQDDHELRGFASVSGGVLKLRSKMMGQFAKRQTTGLSDVKRLFSDEERFRENERALLEVRRDQVAKSRMAQIDPPLFNFVQSAVRDVLEPAMSVNVARLIRNRALELIWKTEIAGGTIPSEWLAEFKNKWTDSAIPKASGGAMRLLQLATGEMDVPRLTKAISKRTYALLNFIHSVGDHGQHGNTDELTWSYAASFCLAAIELLESLSLDLLSQQKT